VLISLVVAMARNHVIGRDNALPWRLPEDMKRFKAVTWGKPILMGRRTFESIGKPLPGRTNVVLTRDPHWQAEGTIAVRSVEEALSRVSQAPELVAIGGAEIYRLLLPLAGRIYLTRVEADIAGDTVFPQLDSAQWKAVDRCEVRADERNPHDMTFVTLERVGSTAR
jgi:dihydrofolate reductase